MNRLILTIALMMIVKLGSAQQLHFTTQYLQHNSMINPAAAGLAKQNMVGLSYRNQWSSFPGNPKTYMAYTDVELEKLNAGIGAYLYRDETGPSSRTGLQLAYAYHIKARNEKDKFSIGLELRGLQYAIDRSKISNDIQNDPALAGAQNKTGLDAGAGFYYTNDKLSLGAAVSQLIQSKLQLTDVPGASLNGKLYRHYNATASYKIQTGEDVFIIPNAIVRVIENSPTEFEAGVLANYKEKIWWGVGYRLRQSLILQAGLRIKEKVSLGYSYDFYVNPIDVFSAGAGGHELGLRFHFDK